jgi:hypothetical protein
VWKPPAFSKCEGVGVANVERLVATINRLTRRIKLIG